MKKTISVILAVVLMAVICVPVFAAKDSLRPSVTTKSIPSIVKTEYDGGKYDAVVTDENGNNPVAGANNGGEIIITAYADVDRADPVVDRTAFKKAYNELFKSNSLAELNPSIPADYVVRDFFDITLKGSIKDQFDAGKSITITFAVSSPSTVYVLTRCSTADGWKTAKVKNNGDSITVTFSKLCPVAIAVKAEEGEVSPSTSNMDIYIYAALAGVFAIAAAGVFFYARKKSVTE